MVCLIAAWLTIPQMIGDNAEQAAMRSALQTAKQFKTIRGYYTKNVIGKAKASGALKPSIDHADNPNAIPLPATFIHDLSKLLSKMNTKIALYSAYPFPNRQNRKLDEFNKSAWEFLSKNPDQVYQRKQIQGEKTVLRVAVADKLVADACVNCHNSHPQTPKNDWKLGDVRGVLEINADISETVAAAASVNDNILLGIFFAGLIVLVVVVVAARAISKPIKQITHVMSEIARGDLSIGVPHLKRQDEVGLIAGTLEIFKGNIQRNKNLETEQEELRTQKELSDAEQKRLDETISSQRKAVVKNLEIAIENMSDGNLEHRIIDDFPEEYQKVKSDFNNAFSNLSRSLGEIRNASSQILAGSGEIHDAANNLAKSTEQQAVTVEQTAAALEETTTAMKTSTERAQEAGNLVAGTKDSAEHSGEIVLKAVSAMGEIEKSSEEIANIIGVIDDIAFQTNLLALNAGVEAARAGESGKGFAVVAQEVRELAQRSASAAKEIKQLITTSSEQVKTGAKLVNETGKALEQIVSEVTDINEHVSAIVSAANEQSVGLQEINQSINNIDQVTQQNAAVAEQSTAASLSLSEEVSRIDEKLKGFKTGDNERDKNSDVESAEGEEGNSPVHSLTNKVARSFGGAAAAVKDEAWEEF